jgi:peroxiredoxin
MSTLLTLGQRLPELSVLTATGAPSSVQAHLGRGSTLLYFLHGTWCPECVSQLYRLQRYRREIQAAGADVIAITQDAPETLASFLISAVPPLEYVVLADPEHVAYEKLEVSGDTLAVIVDRDGFIRWFVRWADHHARPNFMTILQQFPELVP